VNADGRSRARRDLIGPYIRKRGLRAGQRQVDERIRKLELAEGPSATVVTAAAVGTSGPESDTTAIHDNVAGEIAAIAEKLAPVAADKVVIEDSGAGNAKKMVQVGNLPSSGGAPTTADYLVGTVQGGLSAEIVVGTTPGGQLGGTWGSPTVDPAHAAGTYHEFDEMAAPGTPAAAKVRVYAKADGKMYRKDDAGTEAELGGGGAHTFDSHSDVPAITEAQGQIIYWNGSNWVALAPGTSGHFLKTQGAGLNPVWAAAPAGGGGLTFESLWHLDGVMGI